MPQLAAIPIAVVLMLLAMALGSLRLLSLHGIVYPTPMIGLQYHHGELMVFGFLAPLIITERYLEAASLSLNRGIRVMPFIVVAGAVLKLYSWVSGVTALDTLGSVAISIGVALLVYLLYVLGKQSTRQLPFRYMTLGALALLAGVLVNVSGSPVGNPAFILLVISFPVLTILGERVQHNRFLSPGVYRWAGWCFWAAVAATASLLLRILVVDSAFLVAVWAVLLAVAVVPVLRPELTLVRVRQPGLQTYLGRHLILAYGWLFLGLAVLVIARESYPAFDAATHSIAIGFVLTMIIAHTPVIAPSILHFNVIEEKLGYYPLALLTIGTLMRAGGNLLQAVGAHIPALAGLSGLVILLAIISFGVMMLRSSRMADEANQTVARWECQMCGYIYAGVEPPQVCPRCGAPKSEFKRLE